VAGTIWLFIDETGNSKFGNNGSRYFGLASVATQDPEGLSLQLDRLRHRWWSEGHIHPGYFHARDDCWIVRESVFDAFGRLPLVRADVLALLKEGVLRDRRTPELLYRTAARELLRFVMPTLANYDSAVIVAAEWRPLVEDVAEIIRDVLTRELWSGRTVWSGTLRVMQAAAGVHAGLQVADYVAWASNRRRMHGDARWVSRIHEAPGAWSDHVAFE
jgi:hypothetical protein